MSLAPIQMFAHAAPGTSPGGCPQDWGDPCLGQAPSPKAQDILLPEQQVPKQSLSPCPSPHYVGPALRASNLPQKKGSW